MAEIPAIPKIRCDNCGTITDQSGKPGSFTKPGSWGSLNIVGPVSDGAYGMRERLNFTDLCPECIQAAFAAAHTALKELRHG